MNGRALGVQQCRRPRLGIPPARVPAWRIVSAQSPPSPRAHVRAPCALLDGMLCAVQHDGCLPCVCLTPDVPRAPPPCKTQIAGQRASQAQAQREKAAVGKLEAIRKDHDKRLGNLGHEAEAAELKVGGWVGAWVGACLCLPACRPSHVIKGAGARLTTQLGRGRRQQRCSWVCTVQGGQPGGGVPSDARKRLSLPVCL